MKELIKHKHSLLYIILLLFVYWLWWLRHTAYTGVVSVQVFKQAPFTWTPVDVDGSHHISNSYDLPWQDPFLRIHKWHSLPLSGAMLKCITRKLVTRATSRHHDDISLRHNIKHYAAQGSFNHPSCLNKHWPAAGAPDSPFPAHPLQSLSPAAASLFVYPTGCIQIRFWSFNFIPNMPMLPWMYHEESLRFKDCIWCFNLMFVVGPLLSWYMHATWVAWECCIHASCQPSSCKIVTIPLTISRLHSAWIWHVTIVHESTPSE